MYRVKSIRDTRGIFAGDIIAGKRFPPYWNFFVTGGFPHQKPVMRSFSLLLAGASRWTNTRGAGIWTAITLLKRYIDVELKILYTQFTVFLFNGLGPVLEGFVFTMHEGACETRSQIPTPFGRGISRTVRTYQSALWQQTTTDRS